MFKSYSGACVALIDARRALANAEEQFEGGLLGAASADARARANALAKAQAQSNAAAKDLKKAAADEAAARQQKDAAAQVFDLTCKNDADKNAPSNAICDAIARLKQLGNLGIKTISEEQIQQIDVTLAALSGSATPEERAKLPAGLALLSTSTQLADALQQYRTADKLPALEPLIIEKQLASARLKLATQSVELEKLRVALAQERYEALWLELNLLVQARAQLGALPAAQSACTNKNKVRQCPGMSALLTDKTKVANDEPAGRVAFRALTLLSESYSVARARSESAELRLVLADYRDSLIASEGSVAAWDALVATPVAQLQAYHSTGVKPEDIARLVQALGVVGIAVRVD
jgi:hypothetical protein